MKQSGPLKRYTALKRYTPLSPAKVPMRRKTETSKQRLWEDVRLLCYARAEGRCDYCGHPLSINAFDCHHRRRRSQGGDDSLLTCIAVHRICHDVIHQHVRDSLLSGFLCKSWQNPAVRPLHLHHDVWVIPKRTDWALTSPQFDQIIGGPA